MISSPAAAESSSKPSSAATPTARNCLIATRASKSSSVVPALDCLTLEGVPSQLSDDEGDRFYYSLPRFLEVALNANPNTIELLFTPKSCARPSSQAI